MYILRKRKVEKEIIKTYNEKKEMVKKQKARKISLPFVYIVIIL